MNKYIHAVQTYIADHKKDINTAVPIIIFAAVRIGIVVYATVRNLPNIVYQPVNACTLLTSAEAKELLGDKGLGMGDKGIQITGELAKSSCSYTDGSADATQLIVAALAVQSGINDEGVAQNKASFATKKRVSNGETVKNLGDSAFYDAQRGQLNVLRNQGKQWLIISYGIGQAPETNTLEKSVELAKIVLN